ncbi:MAG: pilus assembly protein PilM [Planctomycetes bacterium]|nr:pilus assembly protein PilM [Planctomycetota bacterium]
MSTNARHRKILALDWDIRTLRIVHAQIGKRGVKIDRILSVAIGPDVDVNDPTQLGGHIRRTLEQEGISTKHTIVDVPRDQAILKLLSLPAARTEDLPGIVQIQIAKELPFAAGEAVIDFAVSGGKVEASNQDVLVAAIRREVLQQYEATIEAAGLKLDRIGLRPYANKIAACAQLRFAMPERVVFIDVRPALTEIDFIRDSALSFSRAASVAIPVDARESREVRSGELRLAMPQAVDDGAFGEPSAREFPSTPTAMESGGIIQSLLVEVTRSIEAYRADDVGAQIDHALIAGDSGVEEALAEAMQKRLGIPAELYNPASSFGWEAQEGAAASAFAASLGLVLGHADAGSLQFDFLHPKRMVSRTQTRLRIAPKVGAIAALFVIAVVVWFVRTTAPARARLVELDNQISELTTKKSDGKKLLEVMDIIHGFDDRQLVWVDVLLDVLNCLPDTRELVLTQVDLLQKDGEILLKTKAATRETAANVEQKFREFRREGRTQQRFEVSAGAQTEKKGEKYPFWQDFRVTVLNYEVGVKKSTESRP